MNSSEEKKLKDKTAVTSDSTLCDAAPMATCPLLSKEDCWMSPWGLEPSPPQ